MIRSLDDVPFISSVATAPPYTDLLEAPDQIVDLTRSGFDSQIVLRYALFCEVKDVSNYVLDRERLAELLAGRQQRQNFVLRRGGGTPTHMST